MKREVGRYVSEETNYNNWIIQSAKGLATAGCFAPYLVNVATKEYCSICLETAFLIFEEFIYLYILSQPRKEDFRTGIKNLMVVAAAKE